MFVAIIPFIADVPFLLGAAVGAWVVLAVGKRAK